MTKSDRPHLEVLDVDQFGQAHAGAVFLLRGRQTTALIESGTSRSAPRLASALRGVSIDWIFLTHVHLDHAGGAGLLASLHPEATVVVHPRGLPHLIDPTRLVEGVRQANPSLFPLYGLPTPLPASRLRAAADGESFDLGGGVVIEAIDAPGHAPHHLCYFEHRDRLLFAGDAVGYFDVPVDLPLTVPPRFDLERGLATLDALRRRRPKRIAFTHYGLADDAERRISEYSLALEAWFAEVVAFRPRATTDEIVEHMLSLPRFHGLTAIQRELVRMVVVGAVASLPR